MARQAALLEPLPGRNRARVGVVPIEAPSGSRHEWRVEVAVRDRPALLATVSGVLAEAGLDVLDAVIATWDDGAALESFRVRRALLEPAQLDDEQIARARPPEASWLEQEIVAAFDRPLTSPPNPDAEVIFDDSGSPWYTLCEVRSPDRRGLLHTITVGLASAGADVHSARLVTTDGRAVDRFELTDRTGRKLDTEVKDAIVVAITGESCRAAGCSAPPLAVEAEIVGQARAAGFRSTGTMPTRSAPRTTPRYARDAAATTATRSPAVQPSAKSAAAARRWSRADSAAVIRITGIVLSTRSRRDGRRRRARAGPGGSGPRPARCVPLTTPRRPRRRCRRPPRDHGTVAWTAARSPRAAKAVTRARLPSSVFFVAGIGPPASSWNETSG